MKEHRLEGMKMENIIRYTKQILKGIQIFNKLGIIHSDLKPENIAITNDNAKIIDLGSTCFNNFTFFSYIQSRHYRAPEVSLGMQYSNAIDMWSLGCIVAEMFLGTPIFPANSSYDLVRRFIDTLGMIPHDLLDKGPKTKEFFKLSKQGDKKYKLKETFEYEFENNITLEKHKEYLNYTKLEDICMKCQFGLDKKVSTKTRYKLYDFLKSCFEYNPEQRLTPDQALKHPLLTNEDLENWKKPEREIPFTLFDSFVCTTSTETMLKDVFSKQIKTLNKS